ncbi:mechanosensitive ion channel family protein [Litorimonas sp. WD9-15]|uniref:mechanosensitive ion channel family protein n=1 Tax=Litorimonas sp. WD9-15 TaxID=3418716 RepID=UPI003D0008C9
MENDIIEGTGDAIAETVGFFSPDNLLELWQGIQPAVLNFIFALLILWIGLKIAKAIGTWVRKLIAKNGRIDDTLGNFFASIIRYIVTAFVVIAAVQRIGVETASLVAMLGAATLAIGLALQGTLGNVAAGVMLMLFRPYKLGDFVDVAGEQGVVSDINIFTTQLATIDNVEVIIANGEAWGGTIKNFTSMGVRRVDVDYGIHYDDDIDKAIAIIKDVAAAHPHVLSEPDAPWAKVVMLNESSVDIQSRVWCKAEHYWDVMFDLNKSIKEAFDKDGITIPYPHSVELSG